MPPRLVALFGAASRFRGRHLARVSRLARTLGPLLMLVPARHRLSFVLRQCRIQEINRCILGKRDSRRNLLPTALEAFNITVPKCPNRFPQDRAKQALFFPLGPSFRSGFWSASLRGILASSVWSSSLPFFAARWGWSLRMP